jgi:NTP pyrophosphatase (non-canonical NTP hydrolase)
MPGLTFTALRKANLKRVGVFRNSKGGLAHSKPDGSDWSPAQWLQATIGELGEYANVRKKFERGDMTFEEYRKQAERELADVQTYLDLLARHALNYTDETGKPLSTPPALFSARQRCANGTRFPNASAVPFA